MPMRDTARSLPWSVPARPEGRSVGERGGAGPAAHAPWMMERPQRYFVTAGESAFAAGRGLGVAVALAGQNV
jgi:hypothetical protein